MSERLDNDYEVIARKMKVGGLYLFAMIMGLIVIFFAVCILWFYLLQAIFIMLTGVILAVLSGVIYARIAKTPEIIITRNGDSLTIPCGSYKISSIDNVIARRAHGRGISYNWGKVIITIEGTEYKLNYVADVENVQKRLIELMLESRKGAA